MPRSMGDSTCPIPSGNRASGPVGRGRFGGRERFAIPSTKRGYLHLVDRIRLLLKTYDLEDNLFILYYGGHALQDEQSQTVWVSKRHAGSSFPVSASLHLFVEMDADALLLFDSCQAVPQPFDSKGKGIVSAITATGFEPNTIGTAAEVGPHSFTHALIQVLGVLSIPSPASTPPPTDILLHTLLISELRKYNSSLERESDGSFKRDTSGCHLVEPCRRKTPIHSWLSRNKSPRHILLLPLRGAPGVKVSTPTKPSTKGKKPVYDVVVPEVLVTVRLTPDSLGELDIEAWVKWVLSLPGHPTQVSVKERSVSIEGLYRSHSSLLILRMPSEIYSYLRKFKAMTLIGYVTGENQADEVNKRAEKLI
ncbi:hypothetical protein QBC34DRAFT_144583 [Podospora aff. communis PSN243]|uniref:Caspase domain-containing protein n=1 Tax=Podospora aff. communis PSN243 TaxID=3040156 RepID=A0AAV9GGH5_9PEZI|nr:hypothetical protein QBC34DRAFT_144583 [Podospora aff. communis PSN243]